MKRALLGVVITVALLAAFATMPLTAGAWVGEEFVSGGLLYQVTSESGSTGTVKVVTWGAGGHPGGAISVPNTVSHNGITYTVNWIENWIWDLSASGITSIDLSAMQHLTRIEYGFRNANSLQTVILPASLTSVGDYAFAYMGNIRSVDFSRCVNLDSLGTRVFENSHQLQTVDFRNTKIEVIPGFTFHQTYGLVDVFMPETLLNIGMNAFDKSGIQSLDLRDTNLHDIGGWAFLQSGLRSISFPATLHVIGENVFNSNSQLHTVSFAENSELEYIGFYAFYGCSNLVNMNLDALGPELTYIGKSSFEFTGLKVIDLSGATNLERIYEYTFFSMNRLTDIILPESMKNIDNNAFDGAINLETVTFLSMEPPTISEWAFLGVPQHGTVYYREGATGYTQEDFAHTQLVEWLFEVIDDGGDGGNGGNGGNGGGGDGGNGGNGGGGEDGGNGGGGDESAGGGDQTGSLPKASDADKSQTILLSLSALVVLALAMMTRQKTARKES